ncbi:MAG: hypothetical protein JW969_13865, partial [Spirochaetales bacterium]|nr:hypothetical protein [Spirochaetales bacterium]
MITILHAEKSRVRFDTANLWQPAGKWENNLTAEKMPKSSSPLGEERMATAKQINLRIEKLTQEVGEL